MHLEHPIPVLRIFDIDKAKEFYCGFLEFSIDWEHRFQEGFPLYLQISKDSCRLHLSEHYGDSCPGSGLFIPIDDVDGFNVLLLAKAYGFARPGVEDTSFNTRQMMITDPFGNRLTFAQFLDDVKASGDD